MLIVNDIEDHALNINYNDFHDSLLPAVEEPQQNRLQILEEIQQKRQRDQEDLLTKLVRSTDDVMIDSR